MILDLKPMLGINSFPLINQYAFGPKLWLSYKFYFKRFLKLKFINFFNCVSSSNEFELKNSFSVTDV